MTTNAPKRPQNEGANPLTRHDGANVTAGVNRRGVNPVNVKPSTVPPPPPPPPKK